MSTLTFPSERQNGLTWSLGQRRACRAAKESLARVVSELLALQHATVWGNGRDLGVGEGENSLKMKKPPGTFPESELTGSCFHRLKYFPSRQILFRDCSRHDSSPRLSDGQPVNLC